MPQFKIDDVIVTAPEGATILQAAKLAGLEIPHLCWMEGVETQTSCLVCVVRVNGGKRLLPACATKVAEGMVVENDTPAIRLARRTALELLLAEHTGECFAPCAQVCPAKLDIPEMISRIRENDLEAAVVLVREALVLPAVLGYVCPGLCEKGCRRGAGDEAVSICELHRYVAETDLKGAAPWLPEKHPATGKRVAIVGSGPAGLAAAWELLKAGHACVIYEAKEAAGGTLRQIDPAKLPPRILDAEIELICRLGAEMRFSEQVTAQNIPVDFDAVVWTVMPQGGMPQGKLGWFVSASAMAQRQHAVQAVADGKDLADQVGRFLRGESSRERHPRFAVRLGVLNEQDMKQFMARAEIRPRVQTSGDTLLARQASEEAQRCMLCGCGSLEICKLRRYAQMYGADSNRYRGQRRPLLRQTSHPSIEFEEGKCISCGLCVAITRQEAEGLGLSFVGRGFEVRVAVPFGKDLEVALQRAGDRVVKACPTGALHYKGDMACGTPRSD